jgi:uracil-DNA glycosylase
MRDYEKLAVDSYVGWWSDAGLVDAVQDAGASWLQSPSPAAAPEKAVISPLVAEAPAVLYDHRQILPNSVAAFEEWLQQDAALPGARWSPTRIMPAGPAPTQLMVIGDMPDPDDMAAGHLLAGEAGALFDAMLGAINLRRADLRLASIALTRPPGGRWDEAQGAALRDVAVHHISLVQPERVLLLGQTACRLLTGEDVPADGHGLRNINHYGVRVAAVAIHHPRTLLKQQALKRGAWTALKLFREPV